MYGNFKTNEVQRAASPTNRPSEKGSASAQLNLHPISGESQATMSKKYPKGAK